LWIIQAAMWSATLAVTINAALEAPLPKEAPWWCRPLVAVLHVIQPALREWRRVTYDLSLWRPKLPDDYLKVSHSAKEIDSRTHDLYWTSSNGLGRENLLGKMVQESRDQNWLGVFSNAWAAWDLKLVGDLWYTILIYTATEELGDNKRFTRARCIVQPTLVNRVISVTSLIWSAAALMTRHPWALAIAIAASGVALVQNLRSRRQCLRAATSLMARAGEKAELTPVNPEGNVPFAANTPPAEPASVEYALSPLAGIAAD
jgi:hypothetical protein